MIRNTKGSERLYLSKKDSEIIYVENCKIPQHHIDGIRFLYRQYKKKKPGAIINDTTGYGKNLQIVLFLKALCHLLEQPVLILCQEGAEHGWMEQFQTWTDMCDDVVLETKKPHIKKQILINTMSNLSTFCSRNWSILVVDVPELDKTSLQILGLPFKADYKIWVTPNGIKENLDDFTRIYKWFYPKGEFDKKGYIPDKNNPYDVVDKAILLDTFMEDIVAKIEDTQALNECNQVEDSPSPPRKVSLKNKDSTGKKIKRSKRKIHDDDDDDLPLSKTSRDDTYALTLTPPMNDDENPIINKINENITVNNINENITVNEINEEITDCEAKDDFSIDNFIRKSKESENITYEKGSDTEMNMDTSNSQSLDKLYYEPDTCTDDRLYEMDTLVFEEQSMNVNEPEKDIIEAANLRHTENIVKETNSDLDNENSNDVQDMQNTKFNNLLEENVDNEIIDTKLSQDRESPSICDEFPSVNDNKNDIVNEVHMKSDDNELNEVKKSVKSPLKSNCVDVDKKMKEMEDKVFKKFKGSLLDRLF